MKTILITFPFGIAARNMICSRVVEKFREKDFRVIVIAPQASHKMLREIYPDEGIVFEAYPKYEGFFKGGVNKDAGLIEQTLMGLINASLNTGATRYRRKEQWLRKRYFTYFRRLFFQSIFSGRYKWSEYFRRLDEKYFPDKWFDEIFKKYKPVAVFSPHVQFDFNLIKQSRKRNVPSFGQILSIDNLTTKGNIRTKSDYLFVWNDIMKKEAIEYNLYDSDNVKVVGIPQYDIYYNRNILMSREEFCAQIGVDPNKKILVYASEAGDSIDDEKYVSFFLESQRANRFVKSFSIVARMHPRDITDPFKNFKNTHGVVVNRQKSEADIFIDHWYPSFYNIKLLVNLMYHCSLVIMEGSTIGLDATGFNKPVISLGFDIKPKPYYLSVRKSHDNNHENFPHQRFWFDTGAFRVTTDQENFIKEINRYLEHPEYEKNERKNLIDKLFYKFDGCVGDRIVDNVINYIQEKRI